VASEPVRSCTERKSAAPAVAPCTLAASLRGKRVRGRWRLDRASPRWRLATAARTKAQVKRSRSAPPSPRRAGGVAKDRSRSSAPPPGQGRLSPAIAMGAKPTAPISATAPLPLPLPGNRVGSQRCFAQARNAGRGLPPPVPRGSLRSGNQRIARSRKLALPARFRVRRGARKARRPGSRPRTERLTKPLEGKELMATNILIMIALWPSQPSGAEGPPAPA